jgi:hypothetical protein
MSAMAIFGKCAACNAKIIGGKSFLAWKFCNDACVANFKTQMVERIVGPEMIADKVRAVAEGPCPICGGRTGNDVYSSTTVTGVLVFVLTQSSSRLSCLSCARKKRLRAFFHCLLLGWWSPKALIYNVFVLPTNLFAAALTRQPEAPSPALVKLVKAGLAEALAPQIVEALTRQSGEEKPPEVAEESAMPRWDPKLGT